MIIPQGGIIAVDVPTTERMVAIEWEGKQATMFAEDLRARGIPLEPAGTNGAASEGLNVETNAKPPDSRPPIPAESQMPGTTRLDDTDPRA